MTQKYSGKLMDQMFTQHCMKISIMWVNKWQLKFHPDKCISMSINRKMNYNEAYKMDPTELRQVRQEKDIEVIVDNQLKFENHMQEKVKKANNIMGLIRRTFVHLDEGTFSKLFKALVRPHIEYANTAWYPTKMKDIIAIENVQR